MMIKMHLDRDSIRKNPQLGSGFEPTIFSFRHLALEIRR